MYGMFVLLGGTASCWPPDCRPRRRPAAHDSRAVGFSRKALDGLEPAEMIAFEDQFSHSASFQRSLVHLLTSARVMRMIQRFAFGSIIPTCLGSASKSKLAGKRSNLNDTK